METSTHASAEPRRPLRLAGNGWNHELTPEQVLLLAEKLAAYDQWSLAYNLKAKASGGEHWPSVDERRGLVRVLEALRSRESLPEQLNLLYIDLMDDLYAYDC